MLSSPNANQTNMYKLTVDMYAALKQQIETATLGPNPKHHIQ